MIEEFHQNLKFGIFHQLNYHQQLKILKPVQHNLLWISKAVL